MLKDLLLAIRDSCNSYESVVVLRQLLYHMASLESLKELNNSHMGALIAVPILR